MELLYVLERFPGGTLNFVYNEIRCLEGLGFSVEIVSLLPAVDVPSDAADFTHRTRNIRPVAPARLARAFLHYLCARPLALARLLLVFPFDGNGGNLRKPVRSIGHVVYGVYLAWLMRGRKCHIHAHFAFKAATAAYVVSVLNGNTFSFTAHGTATVDPRSRYSLRAKIRQAAFTVTVSEYNKRIMLGLCPEYPPDRILVNRTGIMLGSFPFRSYRPPGRPARIICVATLYPVKNQQTLLRAFARVVAQGLDCTLDLVGRDDLGLGRLLRELADELGVADRVTLRGPVDHGVIGAMLRDFDLAILTSFSEGIPVSLMEAIAVGIPVIGPAVTGLPELIEDGVTGYLVDPQDVEAIANAIALVLGRNGDRSEMVAKGRSRIESDYDMERNARRLAEHFRERLGGGHAN